MDLRRGSGVPIDYDAARHAYTIAEAGWTYPLAPLTGEDALALARSLLGRPGVPYREAILRALDKTAAGLTPELRALLDGAAQVLRPGGTDRDYSAAPWPEMVAAARQRRTVELLYRSRSRGGEAAWRLVDPYAVEAREGRYWELHGWCHRRERISTFALDQVRGLRETGQTFQRREEEWAAFAGLVPGVLRWRRHAVVRGGPELREAVAAEVHVLAALYDPPP